MKDAQVFKRGQVWYVDDDSKSVGSIQAKSRPYVIVSNDACNAFSPVIHMAPITTQEKTSLPTHVYITDPVRKDSQIILIEQVMPKSVPDIINKSRYKYTLGEDKINEIDKALTVQFGIQYSDISLDDFEELLDMMIEKKMSILKQSSDKLTSDRADMYLTKFMEKLDSIESLTPMPTEPKIDSKVNPIVIETPAEVPTHVSSSESMITIAAAKSTKNSKGRWTNDTMKQFLEDIRAIGVDQVLVKYEITKSTYNTLKAKFQRELGIPPSSRGGRKPKIVVTSQPTVTEGIKDKRESNKQKYIEEARFLEYYNTHTLSEVTARYKLPNNEAAVERACYCRELLEV